MPEIRITTVNSLVQSELWSGAGGSQGSGHRQALQGDGFCQHQHRCYGRILTFVPPCPRLRPPQPLCQDAQGPLHTFP